MKDVIEGLCTMVLATVCVAIILVVIGLLGGCGWRSGGPAPCQPQPNGSVGDGGGASRNGTPCEIRR